jgi:hypothetical protein
MTTLDAQQYTLLRCIAVAGKTAPWTDEHRRVLTSLEALGLARLNGAGYTLTDAGREALLKLLLADLSALKDSFDS